ncbi:MAG: GH92 family glycosyl hydrolase [Polyangiaceae bacterium]|nr:GH92 family glycosyl hydrolase [Polyangiaceae bacterium]
MRRALCLLALVPLAGCADGEERTLPEPVRADLFAAIDPRIGNGGIGFAVGSTYPGPAVPFAMIHPSPDTRTASGAVSFYPCSGYYADDPLISAFSLVHFEGTGVPDYGTIGVLPTLGMTDAKRTQDGHMVGFDKASEETRPGYYAVTLADGIRVELTSSERAAIFRFTFPAGSPPVLLLDLDHRLEGEIKAADVLLDDQSGSFSAHVRHFGNMTGGAGGYDLFARGALDVAPKAVGTFDASGLFPGQTAASGVPLGAYLELPAGTTRATLRLAVSFVDAEGAKKNLAAEAPSFDFDGMRAQAESRWRAATDRLEIWGASSYDATLMSTALYHALLMPTLTSDVDGRFVNAKGEIAKASRPRYSDFSLWDTYRTLHPWLLLTEDERNEPFAASLVGMAAEGGAVPVWGIGHGDSHTMIGSPGEIVLAESALKGVAFDDEAQAYALARVAAFGPSPGPVGGRDADNSDYLAKGYVPSDVASGSVSKTQEYAVADAALGRWAGKLGKASDQSVLSARGKSYENVYDPSFGFFRPKKSDGSWAPIGDPTAMHKAYVEGNAWHYLWMVPHDPEGLAQTLGGQDAALDRLREFFDASRQDVPILGVRAHYWPSNEPDISAPWYFAAWGSPGETWKWVDWIVNDLYGDGVDGLPGNDDGGTMSAWLLFAATGLYPLPGTDRYIVSAPRYPRVVLRRPGGDLTVTAWPPPERGMRPGRVTLDGAEVEGTTLTHAELAGAHELRFEMR